MYFVFNTLFLYDFDQLGCTVSSSCYPQCNIWPSSGLQGPDWQFETRLPIWAEPAWQQPPEERKWSKPQEVSLETRGEAESEKRNQGCHSAEDGRQEPSPTNADSSCQVTFTCVLMVPRNTGTGQKYFYYYYPIIYTVHNSYIHYIVKQYSIQKQLSSYMQS